MDARVRGGHLTAYGASFSSPLPLATRCQDAVDGNSNGGDNNGNRTR